MTRVVITGVGSVSPFGENAAALVAGIEQGRRAFGPVSRFDGAKYGIDSAAEIADTDRLRAFDGSRPARFLQAAAEEAVADSGVPERSLTDETAVVLGTTLGSDEINEAMWRRHLGETPDLMAIAQSMSECGGRRLVDRWGITGPSLSVITACAASTNAIGLGLDLIRAGRVRRAIVGGLDTLTELIYGGFASIGALGVECRPFAVDEQREGTVLGENAAVIVLERADDASARGASVYAEVLGYGLANDAFHMTAPHPQGAGAILAVRRCLEHANLEPDDVDYVNAHGTGTSLNDPVELEAMRAIFGERLDSLPVSSIKSQIGHGLSSAGAVEAVATALAIRGGWLPPTGHQLPTIDESVDFVQDGPRPADFRIALSNSFAFGGHAACLALAAWDGE